MFFPIPVGQAAGVVYRELRHEVVEIVLSRADEHVLDEVRLPGELGNEAHGGAGFFVGAAESVGYVKILAGKVIDNLSIELVENFRGHRLVDFTPGNVF